MLPRWRTRNLRKKNITWKIGHTSEKKSLAFFEVYDTKLRDQEIENNAFSKSAIYFGRRTSPRPPLAKRENASPEKNHRPEIVRKVQSHLPYLRKSPSDVLEPSKNEAKFSTSQETLSESDNDKILEKLETAALYFMSEQNFLKNRAILWMTSPRPTPLTDIKPLLKIPKTTIITYQNSELRHIPTFPKNNNRSKEIRSVFSEGSEIPRIEEHGGTDNGRKEEVSYVVPANTNQKKTPPWNFIKCRATMWIPPRRSWWGPHHQLSQKRRPSKIYHKFPKNTSETLNVPWENPTEIA